jgi:hypothetical protein
LNFAVMVAVSAVTARALAAVSNAAE